MKTKSISPAVIKRLPRYYRYLGDLIKKNTERISSKELSTLMSVTASQIRQDLNCFGGFGQQGYGYDVKTLHGEIGLILGLEKGYTSIIVGAGHIGHAIANHSTFKTRGFNLCGIFDIDPDAIGTEINGLTVKSMDEIDSFIKENKPDIAVLALPKNAAMGVADRLVALGIRGFWNFSACELCLPEGVAVENVHLSDSIMTLSYRIKETESKGV
ncbi:MAG: redox-sensing transcriptional repressor Rex [Ruminococcaceae bacterium]|nr:redox-sensing transcriptional repressor Rex [Oscillospiraceae bacterium]